MKKKLKSKSAFFYLRALVAFALVLGAIVLGLFAVTALPGGSANAESQKPLATTADDTAATVQTPNGDAAINRSPQEHRLTKAARPFDGDLRSLPFTPSIKKERPEREPPEIMPKEFVPPGGPSYKMMKTPPARTIPSPSAPAPTPSSTFDGLDFANWGAGHPPDTNGDVGPTYYIQTVNTSIGIYNKATGARVAAFTFDTFMSQGNFGNLCDTDNFGDPVVVYDSFEDRWVITDFAFQLDGSNNVINPPGSFQCFAVSKTGDPVSGGWNYYSINTTGGLGDYPKFGIWPDGLYMTASMFDYAASGSFQNPRLYAFNKFQMYAGAPTVQVVSFNAPSSEFTVLPANARLQTGTPPAGSPNYYAVVAQFLNAISIYKFHVDWNSISLSTLTGPFVSTDTNWWEQLATANQTAPSPQNRLDELYPRLMMQNQYTNIGGVESLWDSHTVGAGNPGAVSATATQSAVRYYQVKVTGGTVEAAPTQAWTHSPDATLWRFMPSAAVDRAGNMAIGYTTSNATNNPALKYAGRLSTDPVNSLPQSEQLLFQGTGSQSGNCGTSACVRWGDYSAMSLDPDGCTFWYTNEYYAVNGLNDLTRIGSFKFSACTSVGAGGTISGTVTASPGGAPISGATVTLGSRTTTTNGSGNYSFTGLPAGTYPTETASAAGYTSSTTATIVVTDGGTTTKNFALTASSQSSCPVDTTQADFQLGVGTNTDPTTSPGNVILAAPSNIDQQNTSLIGSGFGFTNTTWLAQTFTAGVTGQITRVDLNLFSLNCSAVSMPNLTVSIRATASNIPTGADILGSTATITGFCNGAGGDFTANFATPIPVTTGTVYAIVWRAAAAIPPTGSPTYDATVSNANPYAGGRRCSSTTSGSSWAGATGTANNDFGFKVYVNAGFSTSGNLVSSAKDANPATGSNPTWSTLSWTNPSLPSGTSLQFQAAASNNPAGIFNFVGPNGASNTFYTTSGGSLAQFNGFRYLKYKAYLGTTNSANTPTLNDVTVCFADLVTTAVAADAATGTYGGTTNLSATLTANGNGLSGKTVSFSLNGSSVGSTTTNASGVASLTNVSLSGINAGTYPTGVSASFAGDATNASSSGTNSLTVNKANQAIAFTLNSSYPKAMGSLTLNGTATSGLTVTYGSSDTNIATVSGSTMTFVAPGSVTITADQAGNGNYNAAPSVPRSTVITGPIAAADGVTRPANSSSIKIPVSTLTSNDSRIATDGSTQTDNLTITGVTSGTGNTVSMSGAFVFYTPTNPAANAPLTFTYTVSDGSSTATGTVTVTTVAAAPFSLEPVDRTDATYDSGSDTTSITLEFVSTPNQNLALEYSSDNNTWTPYANNPVNTGPSGDFVVTISATGDHAAAWNANMYFRATRL